MREEEKEKSTRWESPGGGRGGGGGVREEAVLEEIEMLLLGPLKQRGSICFQGARPCVISGTRTQGTSVADVVLHIPIWD